MCNSQSGVGSAARGHAPLIEVLDLVFAKRVQDAHEVGEYGLPYTEFELMHVVGHEERVEIESVLAEAHGEGALEIRQA